jgi:four helix bundle protein
MDLAEAVYGATMKFPLDERFGLSSQVRRAVVSVASNIAEGQGRSSGKEFLHHLSIARDSLCEVQTQLIPAARFSYVGDHELQAVIAQADEVGCLLRGLARSVGMRAPSD